MNQYKVIFFICFSLVCLNAFSTPPYKRQGAGLDKVQIRLSGGEITGTERIICSTTNDYYCTAGYDSSDPLNPGFELDASSPDPRIFTSLAGGGRYVKDVRPYTNNFPGVVASKVENNVDVIYPIEMSLPQADVEYILTFSVTSQKAAVVIEFIDKLNNKVIPLAINADGTTSTVSHPFTSTTVKIAPGRFYLRMCGVHSAKQTTTTLSWSEPTSWVSGRVPGVSTQAQDLSPQVVIPSGTTVTVDLGKSYTIDMLNDYGTLINDGALTVNGKAELRPN